MSRRMVPSLVRSLQKFECICNDDILTLYIFCRFQIDVIGFSSDGDARLLRAMKCITLFDMKPNIDVIKRVNANPVCVQDTVHIGTKLRNRLLNSSIVLRIGNEVVTVVHIKMLLNVAPKTIHGLVHSDIYPEDRQNFKSLEKIIHDRVIQSLESNVPHCNATVAYLKMCKQITTSFIEENLDPIERIYRIWNSLYFLRCWRQSIQKTKNQTLAENFISSNAYMCIEINAHALVQLTVKLRSSQNMFLPIKFASQPCEHIFRLFRSMGTSNYTKINFTLNELFHLNARMEMANKICYSCPEIVFPRIEIESSLVSTSRSTLEIRQPNLPSDEQILEAMNKAIIDALAQAEKFGIHLAPDDITNCEINTNDNLLDEILEEPDEDEFNINDPDENIDKLADNDLDIDSTAESHRNIEVWDIDGSVKIIPKSTLIWMLTESKDKLSSDRLKRVQGSASKPSFKRIKHDQPRSTVFKADQLEIGEWAVFETDNIQNDSGIRDYKIGVITGFRILEKKSTGKGHWKQYKSDCVPINTENNQTISKKLRLKLGLDLGFDTSPNEIQVLGVFYTCDERGILRPSLRPDEHIDKFDLKNYIATMKTPKTRKGDNPGSIFYSIPCEYPELIRLLTELNKEANLEAIIEPTTSSRNS